MEQELKLKRINKNVNQELYVELPVLINRILKSTYEPFIRSDYEFQAMMIEIKKVVEAELDGGITAYKKLHERRLG